MKTTAPRVSDASQRQPGNSGNRVQAGRIILILLRFGIGGLFVYAGAMKAIDPAGFFTDVDHYRLLPRAAAVAFAFYLPWLEIIGGACVILKKWTHGALAVLLGLIVLFIGAMVSAWVRGLDVSCGCFGRLDGTASYPWLLVRDVLILGALGWMISAEFRRRT